MSNFSDLVKKANEKKDDKEEKKKSSFSSLVEKAYSGNTYTKLDGTSVSEWGTSVQDVVDRAYKYLSTDKYRKADTSLAEEIDKYASDADHVLQYLRANKSKISDYDSVYNSYFQMVDAVKKYQKSIGSTNELLSQFDNEEDYNNYRIGWLKPDAEVNAESVAARKEKYQSNESRIAELEEASKIIKQLQDREGLLRYGYSRAGYGGGYNARGAYSNSSDPIDKLIDSDSTVIALRKQLEKYGGADALISELESLKAENTKYKHIHQGEDDNYIPITDEVKKIASNREFSNATAEELLEAEGTLSNIRNKLVSSNTFLDDNGNVIDAYTGKVIYEADEYSKALLNNDTEGLYNSLIPDKLGMFLSASDSEIAAGYTRMSASNGNGTDIWSKILHEGDVNAWKELDENEIITYYYKLNTEGQASAYKFLEDMTTELTRRETQKRAEEISDAPLLKQIALNVASIPMNVFGGAVGFLDDASNLMQGKEINPYSRAHMWSNDAQTIRADTAMDIDKLTGGLAIPLLDFSVGDAYQALMSGADSLAGSFLGGTGYGVLMGMGAASSEMKELYERGASTEQMFLGGVLAGAAEMVFEKYSIDKFLEMGDAKSIKGVVINILKQGGVEASEEALTEIANTITDALVMGSQADVQDFGTFVKNVVNAGLGGFISGGGMGAVGSLANYAQYAEQRTEHGQDIIDEGGVDSLKALALEMSGVSKKTTKLANKVEAKPSAKNVGKLSAQLESSITEQNRTDIQKALVEKGLSEKDAKRVAEYLGSTKTLTAEQKAEIDGNENIKAVVDELLDNSKSTINERARKLIAARLGTKINAENSGELSLRNDVNVKERVSESGKTTITETDENGKEVTKDITIDKNNPIAKVKYIDGERIVYLNTDHGTVEASKVNYASEEEGLLYEAFTDMNPAFANAVIKNYDSSVPIQTYINGMREGMILYGMHNFNAVGEDISKNSFLADLSEADQSFALKLGRAYAKADAKKASKDLRSAIKNAAEKAKASEGASSSEATQNKPKKGKVSFEEGVKAETHKQHKKIISLAKHLAKAIGIDIVFYDSRITGKKAGQGANGYFDADTDTIYLDLQNATDDAKTIAYTLSHELVHFIKKWSPQKFNTFAEFLMEQYASHGVSAASLLKRKMVELNTTDADLAYEEMIADACETMLLDSNAVVKLMELRKSDLELFEKIKLHVLKILNDIREAYKKLGYEPTSDEAKALLGMKDVLEKFYSMFEEAAVDATKNYQALGTEGYNEFVAKSTKNANETVFGEASVDVGKTESGVKHQLKAHKAIGEASIAYNERHKKVHKAILQVGIESMYEMAEAMLPYLEEEGILPPDIPGKTIFKNGSYGKTGENTTLCVRTLTYEDFKDRVAEKVGRPLTVSESLLVSQKIYDIATEPQCIYCYVAADRKAYDEYLGEYWKAMDKYIKAMRNGGDSKALYTEYLAGRKDTDAQKKRWSQWEAIAKSGKEYISAKDLTTKRTRDGIIARKNAFSEQIKDAQRYAQSASWAKTVFDYRAYKGDILKMTSTFVDMLNSEYGLRMYSFSDYTPAFIVENMQMIIDASVKGLKSLAYTKDTDYAEIFASTGQAINVSCFAKLDAESGTYVEDNRQGANWEKTKNLRKQYRNVGAVMVATNDAMVEWALKQDWVDVVIPYHIVKTGTTIANEYQWNNYTSESSDKIGNKGANIYPTEHNNDFATYSDLLKERGITPRFSRWYDMVASGELTEEQYMKLVNEVRLPASELSPVVPSFNLDAAKKSFGITNEGNVIEGGFVDKGGYMGGWYRQGVDVNQEVMAVSEDIEAGKSSLDVDYGMSKAGKERVEQRYKKQAKKAPAVNFNEDKYFARQIDGWDTLKSGGYITVGKIVENSPLNLVGAPVGTLYFDNDKIQAAMGEHDDHLTAADVKNIPKLLNHPIVITEYKPNQGTNTMSVYGNLTTEGGTPIVVGIVITKGINKNVITKIRTVHARSDFEQQITDNSVLFLGEDKKETKAWFRLLGIEVPLEGKMFGFIRSLPQEESKVNNNSENSQENSNEHQQKKKLSNRTILANALDTTAQNDIERNKLAQYKEKIALIESEEEKLAELRGKIKELSFAKGVRDTETIKKLQVEANQTANRIHVYDRQLLNLESTTALKGVLEREKLKAYKRAEQKGKEALDAYREEMTKTQRELLTRYKDKAKMQRERATERRDKTTLRRKLRKVIKDLNHLLVHGTKERNVKEEMKETVATALTLGEVLFNDDISNADIVRHGVDSVTDAERDHLEKYAVLLDQLYAIEDQIAGLQSEERPKEERYALLTEMENIKGKIKNRINYLDQKLSDVFVRERARLNNVGVAEVMEKLATDYHSLKDSKNDYVKNAYSEEFYLRLTTLKKDLGGTKVRDMSIYQLQEVYDAFKMVLHMVRYSNSLFREGRTEDLMMYVSNVQREMYEYADDGKKDPIAVVENMSSKLETFAWNELKPVFAFDKLGSETFKKLFWDALYAEGKYARMIDEATEFVNNLRKKHNFSKWDLDTVVKEFTLADGKIFRLTLEDMMSIYAYSKRDQAHKHMTEGGFVFDKNNEYKPSVNGFRGKFALKRKHARLTTTYRVDDGILKAVENFFNEKENVDKKSYVDAMQEYMTAMGEKGNEVSRIMFGIDLFKEKVYMPLQSSTDYLNSNAQALSNTPTQASLKNIGIAKPTDPNADNPIVLRGFDEIWFEHIDKMSKYATFVLPIENLQRVFNNVSRVKGDSDIATQALIEAIYGSGARQYIDQYITDLNGGVAGGSGYSAPLMELFAKAKKTSVSANLSVWVQQYFAIVRAMDMIRPDYFVPFLRKQDKTVDMSLYEEMRKYAPITIVKEMGGFDVGSSRSAKDYMDNNHRGLKGKMKAADEYLNIGATGMDRLGWITIWSAVKKEVATEQKLTPGTDAFYEACNKRFTEVIAYTQVYDSVNSRSGLMRSKSDFNKAATSFMGEPTVSVNLIDKRLHELKMAIKKKDKKAQVKAWAKLGRSLSSVVVSIALSSFFKSIIGANRDDEEDEAWLEKWMKTFGGNLSSNLNPLGMIPYLRDIVSLWEGWSVDRPDMDLIGDIVSSVKKCINDGATIEECLALSGDIANAFGIPAKNIVRDVKGIINFGKAIFDDIRPIDMGDAFVRGWKNKDRSKADGLFEAVMSGDKNKVAVIKATYKTETAYTSALRTALTENDPRIAEAVMAHYEGDINKRASLTLEIEKEGNFSQNIVRGAINNEITRLGNKIKAALKAKETDTAEYKKLVKELREMYPKDFVEKMLKDTIVEEEEEEGEDKLISLYKMDDYFDSIERGNISTANTVKEDLIKTDVANGKDRDEAEADFDSKFTSYLKEKYKDGDISDYEAEDMLINYAGKSEDEASSKIQYWDFTMEYPDYDLSEAAVKTYYTEVEPSGIKIDVYYDYTKQRAKCKGTDSNGDGKADSGTKKREILNVINSLPITYAQKDALYLAEGWAKSTLWEAPWH